jgi:hypothetical protein
MILGCSRPGPPWLGALELPWSNVRVLQSPRPGHNAVPTLNAPPLPTPRHPTHPTPPHATPTCRSWSWTPNSGRSAPAPPTPPATTRCLSPPPAATAPCCAARAARRGRAAARARWRRPRRCCWAASRSRPEPRPGQDLRSALAALVMLPSPRIDYPGWSRYHRGGARGGQGVVRGGGRGKRGAPDLARALGGTGVERGAC